MTETNLPLTELLQKAGDGDFLRAVAEAVLLVTQRGFGGSEEALAVLRARMLAFANTPGRAGGRHPVVAGPPDGRSG